jgi:hypothetical protein
MPHWKTMCALALAAVLVMPIAAASAFDDANYPDWSGTWLGTGGEIGRAHV